VFAERNQKLGVAGLAVIRDEKSGGSLSKWWWSAQLRGASVIGHIDRCKRPGDCSRVPGRSVARASGKGKCTKHRAHRDHLLHGRSLPPPWVVCLYHERRLHNQRACARVCSAARLSSWRESAGPLMNRRPRNLSTSLPRRPGANRKSQLKVTLHRSIP